MLVFVVPLKSVRVSRSWEQVSRLFERSLRSICAQTSPHFKVIVVCHEKPLVGFEHPNVVYREVDFPPPDLSANNPKQLLNQKRTDKGRKMLAGLVDAEKFQPSHTMLVDADDCVSKRLAEFVERSPQANGWFISTGYRYEDGSQLIYLKRRNFYRMCGSCNILRYDLNNLPKNPEYNRGYGSYKYYLDHAKNRTILAEQGNAIAPLPFPGAVYVTNTGENIYFNPNRLYSGIFQRLNYRTLTPAIADEFHLHSVHYQLPVINNV